MFEYKFCPQCSNELVASIHEGNEKKSCPNTGCGFVHWDNPTPVVLALIEYQGRYLITHNVEWPDWKYSLISGFLDSREDPEHAVIREIKEELGLATIYVELITTSIYENLNQLMISFYAKTEGDICLNEEHDAYKLLSLEELRNWEFGRGSIPTIETWLARVKP